MERNCDGECGSCRFCSKIREALEDRDFGKPQRTSAIAMVVFLIIILLSVLLIVSVFVQLTFYIMIKYNLLH